MEEPKTGVEFLAQLREKNGKQRQSFRALFAYMEQKARQKGTGIFGQFELTPLCNLNCKMCYVHLNPEQLKGRSVLPVSTWKDIMYQAWQAGMIHATLTGGECLAYPGFEELYLFLRSLGCEISVLTNGVLLDEKRVQFFKENKPAGIQITLYGWNDDVYERVTGQRVFGTVSQNIRNAIEAGLTVSVSVTPNVYLGEDVLDTIRFAKSLCKIVVINDNIIPPREETGRAEQIDDPDPDIYVKAYRLLNELEGRKNMELSPDQLPVPGGPCNTCKECGIQCGAGRSGFTANWKGNIQPCSRLDKMQGNVLEDGFPEAWRKINQWANEFPRIPKCNGCAYDGICNNCAANILHYMEPGKQLTELCERTKYLVQNGVRHFTECE